MEALLLAIDVGLMTLLVLAVYRAEKGGEGSRHLGFFAFRTQTTKPEPRRGEGRDEGAP